MGGKKKKSSQAWAMAAGGGLSADTPAEDSAATKLRKEQKKEILIFDRDARLRLHELQGDELAAAEAETQAARSALVDKHAAAMKEIEAAEGVVEETQDASEGGASAGQPGGKKKSRAQKRREAAEAEEAAREQRRVEELAGYVDPKEEEDKVLAMMLEPEGLRVKCVPSDGHCLFRSLADQLELIGRPIAGEEPWVVLRKDAAGFMRRHKEDFEPFVEFGDDEAPEGGVLEAYASKLESTACWGGHLELQALARQLKTPIVVIEAGKPPLEFEAGIDKKEGGLLRVSYHRAAFALGEHYNSVVPIV